MVITRDEKRASAHPDKFHSDKAFRRLLDELHAKRRWLDGMILSLEAALDSPERKLVDAMSAALAEHPNTPLVDLPAEEQSLLSRLAQNVRGGSKRSGE